MANADESKKPLLKTMLMRVSYPALQTPRAVRVAPGTPPRPPTYGSALIMDEVSKIDAKAYKERWAAMVQAVGIEAMTAFPNEFIREGAPYFYNQAWKSPWLDGGIPKYVKKNGLGAGTIFIRPTSNRIIPCVDRTGAPIMDANKIYPGCYCYALLAVYSYRNPENHGVSFGLRGLQFAQEGERLDDAVDVSEYFGALEGDELGATDEQTLAQMFKM